MNWTSSAGHATVEVLDLNREQLINGRKAAIFGLAVSLEAKNAQAFVSDGAPAYLCARGANLGPDPHCGAATQAVLSFANYRGMEVDTAESFLKLLYGLPGDDFRAFLGDMAAQFETVAAQEQPVIHADFEALAQPKPTRIPDVQTLPNALRPITRVEISNFKALRTISFDLPETVEDPEQSPCMLLLGENATGKSSVLEAMALAIIGVKETAALDALVDDTTITPNGLIHRPDPSEWSETMDAVRVNLSFLDAHTPVTLHGPAEATAFEGNETCAKVILGYGPRRFFTSRKSRRLRAPAHRVKSMFDPLDVIANPIHWLSTLPDPQFYAAARALREILMLDRDDDFEREDDPDEPRIYIRQGGQRVAMKDLSVGFKSIIAMTCDIIREMLYHFDNLEFASAVVFIDEIETHLHPRWKMQIMTLLRRAFPKIQFIVTTHDPLCLRGMYDGEVFVLHRAGETDLVERVEDLPSIRGMRAEQILTSEFFGLGSTDPETDARLIRFNRLAARIEDLSPSEHDEMQSLSAELDDGLVIGTTLREQAYAEALKDKAKSRTVAPTKAPSPRRAELKSEFANLFARRDDG
ncbi:AAA family ATPase [Gymnodinialimonas sp.]